MPQLTPVGRQTGKPHLVMLTSPLQEGPTIVVVASCGGCDRHPAGDVVYARDSFLRGVKHLPVTVATT